MAAGVLGAVAAFKTVVNVVGSAIKSFRDFEFQMAKVRAVSGASNADFKKLSSTAQELGRTTFFTATQVAELQTNFAKLGFTTTEILDAQSATLDLATATGSDLARAAIVAGSAVRGFGLDASETRRVVDVMAVSFTSSQLDLEKFQTSMTKVAPIAKSAGFSIEDTTSIMASLADAGIEASIAGTSLRNILLKMQDPNSDLTKSFGKTIHSLDELVPALTKFSKEGGSLAEIMEVVDLRQAAAFEQMMTSRDKTVILRDALLKANGAASEMAEIVGDNMEGAFKRFTSALEGLAINITEGFIGQAVTNFLENVTGILTFINEFIDTSKSLDEVTAETAGNLLKESVELQNLANNYDALNSKIDQNTSDRVEMASILDTLETRLGDSVIAIDEETDSLKLNRDALDEVIRRTALLANDEAIKLVHSIRQTDKAIEEQTESLKKNTKSLDTQERQLTELQKTENDKFKDQEKIIQGNQLLLDSEDNIANTRVEGNVISKETAEQQKIINDITDKGKNILSGLNDLNSKRKSQQDLLLEQGFSMAQVEALFAKTTEESTENTKKSTKSIIANTEAKKDNISADEELLNHRLNLMNQGLLAEEEQDKVRKQLLQQEIKRVKDLIALDDFMFTNKTALLEKLRKLESELYAESENENQKQIDGVAQLGDQLINLAGEDEKMQGIRKAGIQISAAAAIANNLLALSNAAVGVTEQSKLTFPANLVAMATTIGTVISLFANIKALKNSFGDGGVVEAFANGGMVQGKSHANGGEKFAVGGRVVELEGGEAVINKRSTSMFRNQLSAMNSAGGGVKFADGGLLNMPSFSQQQFNALGQNQMMGAMGGASKVVVVEADITSTQNSVSVIESDAII